MQYLPDELRGDKVLGLLSVKSFGYTLGYLSPRLRDCEEVVIEAINETPSAIQLKWLTLAFMNRIVMIEKRRLICSIQ